MVDIAGISALISSIKSAQDIIKDFRQNANQDSGAGKISELQAAIFNAYEKALEAKQEQIKLTEKIEYLNKKIGEYDEWEEQKRRFQLVDFGSETYAYVLKEEESNGEPTFKACPQCFANKSIRPLQFQGTTAVGQQSYFCPNCENTFRLGSQDKREYTPGRKPSGSWMAR